MASKLLSRAITNIKAVLSVNKPNPWRISSNRFSHTWNYRTGPKVDKKIFIFIDVFQGFVWWWVLWHFYTSYDMVLGEFPYPNPYEWTDEELGVTDKPYQGPPKTVPEPVLEDGDVVAEAELEDIKLEAVNGDDEEGNTETASAEEDSDVTEDAPEEVEDSK